MTTTPHGIGDVPSTSAQHAIRAVLFDVGGTLTASPLRAMGAVAAAHGIDTSTFARIAAGFGAYDDGNHPWHRFERGEIDEATFNAETVVLGRQNGIDAFPPLPDASVIAASLVVRPALLALVDEARALGLKTAIVTNNVAPWSSWRKSLPIDRFDLVVDSCEIGMRKPEARLFLHVAETLGIAPEACLLLDDMEENCAGARAVGMAAILAAETGDDDAIVAAVRRLLDPPS